MPFARINLLVSSICIFRPFSRKNRYTYSWTPYLKDTAMCEQRRYDYSYRKEVHYSQRQMNRYLNTVVGVSSKNYLRVKRINLAVQMLKQRQCSIEEVAFELGYYDSAHFIHDFTKIMNKTPTMYRENMSDFYSETTKRL